MKRFLKRTLLFLSVFFSGTLVIVFTIHYLIKKSSNFSLVKNDSFVVFGHSHPECAFNDSLIINCTNLAQSGESYFYTYHKAKEVLSKNKLDVVFIEFSNIVINNDMNEWIWGPEKAGGFFHLYLPFMSKLDMLFLVKKQKSEFLKTLSKSTRKNLIQLFSSKNNLASKKYGGYLYLERNKLEEEIKNLPSKVNDTINSKYALSEDNIRYLEKIVAHCNKKKTKVYFIRTPQHKFFSRLNEAQLLEIKNTRFRDIEFLDFDNLPLKDGLFGDLGHLNHKGARVFSLWFNHLIQSGLLLSSDKAKYIKQEAKKINS